MSANAALIADKPIPWTTARCNRLLRPISSRLAQLRKLIETERAIRDRTRLQSSLNTETILSAATGIHNAPTTRRRRDDDPDWIPGQKPKKVIRKYSARGPRRIQQEDAGPVEDALAIGLPTPFVNRTLDVVHDSPRMVTPQRLAELRPKGRPRSFLDPKNGLENLKVDMNQDAFNHFRGIFDAFSKILDITLKHAPTGERLGTRSLLSACLRQVPSYIELEEYWTRADGVEDWEADASASVYTELEGFGSVIGQGWQPLSEAVRAHATRMLADAISDGTLSLQLADRLIMHCIQKDAWDAAQELMSCALVLQKPVPLPWKSTDELFDLDARPLLNTLHLLCQRSHAWGFFFRQLNLLLIDNIIPVEWFATRSVQTILSKALRTMMLRDEKHIAPTEELIETTLILSFGLQPALSEDEDFPQQQGPVKSKEISRKLTDVIRTICTSLNSTPLASFLQKDDKLYNSFCQPLLQSTERIYLSYNVLRETQPADLADNGRGIYNQQAVRRIAFLLSRLFPQASGCRPDSNVKTSSLVDCIKALKEVAFEYKFTEASFVQEVCDYSVVFARTSGRSWWSNDGFMQFKHMVDSFVRPAEALEESAQIFLKKLAMSMANEFAAVYAPDLDPSDTIGYVAFAEKTQASVMKEISENTMGLLEGNAPAPSTGNITALRWEESISEWVTRTPAVTQSMPGGYKRIQPLSRRRISPMLQAGSPTHSDEESVGGADGHNQSQGLDHSPLDNSIFSRESTPSTASSTPPQQRARKVVAVVEIPIRQPTFTTRRSKRLREQENEAGSMSDTSHKRARRHQRTASDADGSCWNTDTSRAKRDRSWNLRRRSRVNYSAAARSSVSEDESEPDSSSSGEKERDTSILSSASVAVRRSTRNFTGTHSTQPRSSRRTRSRLSQMTRPSSPEEVDEPASDFSKSSDNENDDLLFSPGWFKEIEKKRQRRLWSKATPAPPSVVAAHPEKRLTRNKSQGAQLGSRKGSMCLRPRMSGGSLADDESEDELSFC